MLNSLYLHTQSTGVCNKTKITPASFPLEALVTKHKTEKSAIAKEKPVFVLSKLFSDPGLLDQVNTLFPFLLRFFRKSTCLTSTIAVSVISLVILFCDKRSFVAASQKIKTNEGTVYEYDRKMMCNYSPSRVENLLYRNCVKKRKRISTGKLALGEITLSKIIHNQAVIFHWFDLIFTFCFSSNR